MTKEATANTINKLLKEANKCKYCINCQYSYFRPTSYDGYCKYVGVQVGTYMHLKIIDAFDVCVHWENKKD